MPVFPIVTLLLVSTALPVFAVSASQVALNFMCPCGSCDEALSTCECTESDGFRSQIAGMVGGGYTEDQIIQDFTDRFGPDVLIANAAMAPDAVRGTFDKKVIGFIFLAASFSLAAFGLGRYMQPSTSSATPKRRAKSGAKAKTPSRPSRKAGKTSKPGKRIHDGIDEELLDDYDYR